MDDTDKLLLGAGLAIAGGIIGKFVAVFVDEWRERKFIKRSVADELTELGEEISRFRETYDQTNQLVPKYLEKIKSNTEAYDACRNKLYLIWSKKRRKLIMTFYRKLKRTIAENEGSLGDLSAPAGKTEKSNAIMKEFTDLFGESTTLHKSLTRWY
jgi:hypothetical protein